MSEKKRGLGRGLEVLLADTPRLNVNGQELISPASNDNIASKKLDTFKLEQLILLNEAEDLRLLLDELIHILQK